VNNLANDLFYSGKLAEMRCEMMRLLKQEEDPRALGKAEVIETYPYFGSRNFGYDEWLKRQEPRLEEAMKANEAARVKQLNQGKKPEPVR